MTCKNCNRAIRESIDPNVPYVHEDSGNSFCDVTGVASVFENKQFSDRTEAEPNRAMVMGFYEKMIFEATGETDIEKLEEIEDYMRHIIFHSTLDWMDRKTFNKAARKAREELGYVRLLEKQQGILQ